MGSVPFLCPFSQLSALFRHEPGERLPVEPRESGELDHIDAPLLNAPLAVSRQKIGTRGGHSVALLSDWPGMTPLGKLTPRSLELARSLRELRAEILASLHGAGA